MSNWVNIQGVINVCVKGKTNHEILYIINEIVDYLPIVRGSERDMDIKIVPLYATYSRSDDKYGNDRHDILYRESWREIITNYQLVINGDLRDTKFKIALKELSKTLTRLSNKCCIDNILISISENGHKKYIISEEKSYFENYIMQK